MTDNPNPTEPPPQGMFHAWFSEKYSKFNGSSIYQRTDGSEVEVSEVGTKLEPVIEHDDVKYLGPVLIEPWKAGREPEHEPFVLFRGKHI